MIQVFVPYYFCWKKSYIAIVRNISNQLFCQTIVCHWFKFWNYEETKDQFPLKKFQEIVKIGNVFQETDKK